MTLLRRWLLLGAFAVMVGGCGGELGATPTGPAANAPACFRKGTPPGGGRPGDRAGTVGTCRSPDGAWRVTLQNGVGGWSCALYVTRVSTGRRVWMYGSHDAGCSYLTWAKPDMLLFENNGAFHTLNPARRKVVEPAMFGEFVVSQDRRWVAGNAVPGPQAPQETVFVLTPTNSRCVIVPRGANRTDEVVGFTRDSKSIIVNTGPWNATDSQPPGSGVDRQFRLSSLRSDCAGEQLVGYG